MARPLPDDPHFLDIARDVAHRFGSYGHYRLRARALKAFQRRAPGFGSSDYEEALDFFLALYRLAKDAVHRHHHPKGGPYASFEDVDYEAVLAELDEVRPGVAMREKQVIASWSVLYHILM